MAGNRNKKNAAPPQDVWGDEQELLPRADVTIAGKLERRRTFNLWYTRTAVFLLPVVLLSYIVLFSEVIGGDEPEQQQQSAADSPTKSAAMLKVKSWLATTPSPLPGGVLLSWDGAQTQQEYKLITAENGQTTEQQGMELHKLTISTPSGTIFTTTVQVGHSPVRGAQVIGEPTLMPRAPDDTGSWPNLKTWPSLVAVNPSDEVQQSVRAWVTAFTSGDPNSLRLTIGDAQAGRSYVPLVQATASNVSLLEAATWTGDNGATIPEPEKIVARVTFGITWDGQGGSSSERPGVLTYDLLIDKANTAAPLVVAWGGAGTGESLTPYMNAVEGRKITADGMEDVIDPDSGEAASEESSGE